jgi:hypothetical protein
MRAKPKVPHGNLISVSPSANKCEHKRTTFSFGTLGDYEECLDCNEKLERKPDLEDWLRKGLGLPRSN